VIENNYIQSVLSIFTQYKTMAEKAIEQVPDEKLSWQYGPETNSIAIIIKHLSGNMLSRFTDFLISDGEKKWRNRDAEFEPEILSREKILSNWNMGWDCLFNAINPLQPADLSASVVIRNENHTVLEAINRQLAHNAGHIGQIIMIAKMVCDSEWKTLSIPKGGSAQFNSGKGL
jgi:Protein of unknown function (DUF1572)